jgi:hypothetical protein
MKTDFYLEIRIIARRVLAEQEAGRPVDSTRLEWATAVLRGERPVPIQRVSMPRSEAA